MRTSTFRSSTAVRSVRSYDVWMGRGGQPIPLPSIPPMRLRWGTGWPKRSIGSAKAPVSTSPFVFSSDSGFESHERRKSCSFWAPDAPSFARMRFSNALSSSLFSA
eukprot:7389790-Prymnesium_polylepis.3